MSSGRGEFAIMYRILIIEDDEAIRNELAGLLERYEYSVTAPDEFVDIVRVAEGSGADLILLDLGLPHYDGYHICREIRKNSQVPVIVVTSRDTETDELMSLHIGADDFIAKPYNPQILLSRIEKMLNRAYGGGRGEAVLTVSGVSLNLESGKLCFEERTQELTKNEIRILGLLMKNQGKIISRDEIIAELWQSDDFVDDNTLTVNINRLRKKLDEVGAYEFIRTKRGQGYIV